MPKKRNPPTIEEFKTMNSGSKAYWRNKFPGKYPESTQKQRDWSIAPTLLEYEMMTDFQRFTARKKHPDMNYPVRRNNGPVSVEEYLTFDYNKQRIYFHKYPEMNYPDFSKKDKTIPTIEEYLKLDYHRRSYLREKYPEMNYPLLFITREHGVKPTQEEFQEMSPHQRHYYRKKYPEMDYQYEKKPTRGTSMEKPTLEQFLKLDGRRRQDARKYFPEMNFPKGKEYIRLKKEMFGGSKN